MSSKRLVISANTSWYLYNFRQNLIEHFISIGYEVIAVSPADQYSPKLPCKHYNIFIDQNGTNPLKDLYTIFLFIRIYRQLKPGLVLNFTPKNNIYGSIAARSLNIKVINNISGLGSFFQDRSFSKKAALWLYKLALKRSQFTFFQNNRDRNLMKNAGIVTNNNSQRIFGSGVDLKRFSQKSDMANLEFPDGVAFILVARLIYEKGIMEYVEAAHRVKAKYSNASFKLLGILDIENPRSINPKDLAVIIDCPEIEFLEQSDKVELELAKCNCVVLPTYYNEGLPKSLLEGAAMGLPLITTNTPGCNDVVVEHENGYFCKPQDSASLAECFERILNIPESERQRLGANSRKRAEALFSEDKIISAYDTIVNKLLTNN